MRMWAVLVVLLCAGPVAAQSPRIAALEAKRLTEDAFWKQAIAEGTPLVEDTKDPKGRLLVTFVYRGRADTKAVAAYNTTAPTLGGHAQLARVGTTNTFAWSTLVDPAARFTYFLAPHDNLGPPTSISDWTRRAPMFVPDVYNKRPSGVMGSVLEMPKAPPQPWLVPKRDTPAGEVVTHEVKSKALGNERDVRVYTPHGFSKQAARYPLVVMFDGDAAVLKLGLPIALDELIAAKKIPPVVVLLVGNAQRAKELPANPVFADFVAHDLVPWMRASYHVTNDPKLTVIAGISFGGLAAAFAAVRHPNIYGNVLSQSGSYWWSDDDAVEGEQHARDLATRQRLPLRWWLECGSFEVGAMKQTTQLAANRHLRDVLQAKGYDVTYREYAGGHEYTSWRGSIADGLIALLAKPPKLGKPQGPQGRSGGMTIDAARKWIVAMVQRSAILDGGAAVVAKLEKLDAALIGEQEVNQAGYALLELGHAKAALPIFEWNAKRFPRSANVHDSLGEAYYHAGDRARAVASYQKSLELDPKNDNAKKMIALLR